MYSHGFCDNDYLYMQKAISEAGKAEGKCSPNPNVGAVLVKHNKIIARGHTQKCGSNHAEIEALKKAGEVAKGSTLYVTLEPCCHQGRTGPCTKALIEARIKEVVVGITDPNPEVSGKGIALLKENGIKVRTGLLREKIEEQLEGYIIYITQKRPFVVMKNAITMDGKIALPGGESKWITNELSRGYVHLLRSKSDAILTTINTVKADDPLLTARLKKQESRQPTRIIIDEILDLPVNSQISQTADRYRTMVFFDKYAAERNNKRILENKSIEFIPFCFTDGLLCLKDFLGYLYNLKITSIFLEAGSKLNTGFLNARLVDKIYSFIAPKIFGKGIPVYGELGITKMEDAINLKVAKIKKLGDNLMIAGYPEFN